MKTKYVILISLALFGTMGFLFMTTVKAEEGVPETECDYMENPVENSVYFNFASVGATKSFTVFSLVPWAVRLGLRDCCIRDDVVEVRINGVHVWTVDSRGGSSGSHPWQWEAFPIWLLTTIELKLVISGSSGASGWYYDFEYIPFVAEAGGPYVGYEGTPITFDASSSYDPWGYIDGYKWDFNNDGTYEMTTSSPTVSHIYNDDGSGNVKLKVINGTSETDLASVTVLNVAPTLTLSGDPGVDEGSVYILSLGSYDPGADTITHWTIDWGDGSVITYGGDPSSVSHTYADGPNSYTISATATDEDGTFSAAPLTVTVNNVAPIPTILGPLEALEDISFLFSGDFYDPGADTLNRIWWEFTEGAGYIELNTLTPAYTYANPGDYLVRLKVEDDDGGVGETGPFTITVLDKTPPETTLTLGCHYIDEFGTTYVTSSTSFTLEVIDEFSGIAYTKYIINGDEFDYAGPFTLSGPDGIYLVSFYSEDTAGNMEPESEPVEYFLVNLKESSWLTDSDFNPITNFDFIFRKNKDPVGYTLVATNPGQFYYHIEVMNEWPIDVDTLTIQAILPLEFILKGAMPIHVYLGGVDITGLCTIDPETCTITVPNVPSGQMVYVTIHMDFGIKGNTYDSLSDFVLQGYIFKTEVVGEGGTSNEGLCATHYSSLKLIGHQKKTTGICGFVTDTDGNPRVGVEVYLYAEDGAFIAITVTDVNGFYYFFELNLPTYIVSIGPIDTAIVIMVVTVKKDEFTEANLSY